MLEEELAPSKKFSLDGFSYTFQNGKETAYFRCSKWRGAGNCKARVQISKAKTLKTGGYIITMANWQDILINRTNNPLENFNCILGEAFTKHPSVVSFFEGIKQILLMYVTNMRRGRNNIFKQKKTTRAEARIDAIPEDYHNFETA